jgi:hypothetical protein
MNFALASTGALCALLAAAPAAVRQVVSDADSREIAMYRLTLDGLRKVINVNRALVQQLAQDPKAREAMKIEAEITALEKKDDLSEADQKRLEMLRARLDELENAADNPLAGESKTLADMEARIRTYPPLMQALQKEGMSPRDYGKFWLAFIQATFASGFKKSGMLKELPPDVNPENVKFVEEHAAEIAAMQKEFEALGRNK